MKCKMQVQFPFLSGKSMQTVLFFLIYLFSNLMYRKPCNGLAPYPGCTLPEFHFSYDPQ